MPPRSAPAEAPPRGTPSGPRQRTLRQLSVALASLLSEGESLTRLSVERLLARADVARSTFYAHYDGKAALLRDVGAEVVTEVLEASRRWSKLPDDADREALREALDHLVAVYREHATLMGAMTEVAGYDEPVRQELSRLITVGQAELTRHVQRGQRKGSVRADVDPVMTIRWLMWMVERCLYAMVRTAPAHEVRRHVDAATGIIWSALYEGTPRGQLTR
jgi:AcrR family transcriptional regulator